MGLGELNFERTAEMVKKELRQIWREPRLRRLIFLSPMIQLIVFGYAVSTDIRHTRTFLVDHDRTAASRALADAFTGSGYFTISGSSERAEDLRSALDDGTAVLGIEIPAGFARDLQGGGGADVQLLLDGTNSNIATVVRGYAERIVLDFGRTAGGTDLTPAVELRERAWYNPDLKSRNYNVPAVVGTIMMLISLLLTSLAIVREREIGTLEQLLVSPLTAREMIAGKTIPFALIGMLDMIMITTVALVWFGIPFRGNFLLLLLAGLLYLLPALGLGLFISTISSTQQEAFLVTFLVMMPVILLSGFMFPVSSMPKMFEWLTLLNPMRHFLEIVRGVFLKGSGVVDLWRQLVTLAVMGPAVLLFAAWRFKRLAG
jgi:ABC-2 type transport system permease protein